MNQKPLHPNSAIGSQKADAIAIYLKMRCAGEEFLDTKMGYYFFHSGTNHTFLTDGLDHIVGSENAFSFLQSKFGSTSDEKPENVYSVGVNGFGRCHEFLRKRFVVINSTID